MSLSERDMAFYRAWADLLDVMRAYADGRDDVIFQKEADFPDYIYRMARPYDLPTIVMSASLSRPDGYPVLMLNASPRHAVFKEIVVHPYESHVYRKATLAADGEGLTEGPRRFDADRFRALADQLFGVHVAAPA
ncbi:MAG: NADH-quinone oxidoreductase subunit 15 [Trueperaceae bacterium]